jgi:hypothetical protein
MVYRNFNAALHIQAALPATLVTSGGEIGNVHLVNKTRMGDILRTPVIGLFLLGLVATCVSCSFRPSFNPDKVAQAEARMWRAYYAGSQQELGRHVAELVRNQFGISMSRSIEIGRHLAIAAIKFSGTHRNYDTIVLPDLVDAYTRIRDVSRLSFDPEEVARAELEWWVARRTPGANSVQSVGARIADLYEKMYGRRPASFDTAGMLRAQAAQLRDTGGTNPDWPQIENLLKQSYRELEKGLK